MVVAVLWSDVLIRLSCLGLALPCEVHPQKTSPTCKSKEEFDNPPRPIFACNGLCRKISGPYGLLSRSERSDCSSISPVLCHTL